MPPALPSAETRVPWKILNIKSSHYHGGLIQNLYSLKVLMFLYIFFISLNIIIFLLVLPQAVREENRGTDNLLVVEIWHTQMWVGYHRAHCGPDIRVPCGTRSPTSSLFYNGLLYNIIYKISFPISPLPRLKFFLQKHRIYI